MRLLGYFRSSSSYRCRIALNLKGISYDYVPVHLTKGEHMGVAYGAINPQKLVPSLITDDGQTLIQSLAIVEWLDETYPEPRLLPQDTNLRAQVRGFAQIIACEVHPLQNLRILKYLTDEFGAGTDETHAWLARWLGDGLAACEALLERSGRGTPYCFGDAPGLADICLAPQIFSADRFGVDRSSYKRLNAVYDNCQALSAFADARPDQQPDYEG